MNKSYSRDNRLIAL